MDQWPTLSNPIIEINEEEIKEDLKKLKKDFWVYMKSTPKPCKLVILAQGGSIKY